MPLSQSFKAPSPGEVGNMSITWSCVGLVQGPSIHRSGVSIHHPLVSFLKMLPCFHSSWHFQKRKGVPMLGKGQTPPELPKASHPPIDNWWEYWGLINVNF